MKKLSEYKDDEALDLLADLLEPCVDLFGNEDMIKVIRTKSRIEAVTYAIKNHKAEVVKIMAILNGTTVEDFHYTIFTLPMMVVEVLNDKELLGFFKSQSETAQETVSGSVTENTEEKETPDISSDT